MVLSIMTEINNTPNNEYAEIKEYASLAPNYDRRWTFYINATLRETLKHWILIQPTGY